MPQANHICFTSFEIIVKQKGTRKNIYNYSIDDKFIKYHVELNEFSNKYHERYHEHFINKYELMTKTA